MKVAIIQYNSGNVLSVQNALKRIGVDAVITDDKDLIAHADKVIFPGVGHAASAMKYLKEKKLDQLIIGLKQPVLGICLGMQLMCKYSDEGQTECLGIFDTHIKVFESSRLKVPQVGWNSISNYRSDLFDGLSENEFVYCVHSYFAELSEDTVATSDYTKLYSAALQKSNFYAVQFHPEKSGAAGERILKNFIELI